MPEQYNLIEISRIEIEEFTILNSEFDSNQSSSVNVEFTFGSDLENKIVGIRTRCNFTQAESVYLTIAVAVFFRIGDVMWKEIYHPDKKKIQMPKEFAIHLSGIVLSSARGIIFEKTRAAGLSFAVLPLVNLQGIYTTDIVEFLTGDRQE